MANQLTDLFTARLSAWQLPDGFSACGHGEWRRSGQRWLTTLSCLDTGGNVQRLPVIADPRNEPLIRVTDPLGYASFGSPGATPDARAAAAALALLADQDRLALEALRTDRDRLTWDDPDTGLIWMRASLTGFHDWDEAMGLPGSFNQAGGCAGWSDWRLPTKDELLTLVRPDDQLMRFFPENVFPEMDAAFARQDYEWLQLWSSSPVPGWTDGAWGVYLGSGLPNKTRKNNPNRVRLVRGVQ